MTWKLVSPSGVFYTARSEDERDRMLTKGFRAQDEESEAEPSLDDHTVAELREIAEAEGVELDSDAKKADIVAAIEDSRE